MSACALRYHSSAAAFSPRRSLICPMKNIGSGLRGNYVNYTTAEEQNIAQLVAINGDIPGANL